MAVTVVFGPPGSGKSYFGVWLARRALRRGRRVYSTFPIEGARGLLTLAHAWCEEFAGSDFIVDEAGSMFNARDFKDLDPLVFGALTHSRHQDVNVYFLCQHPMYLETNFRRVAEHFISIRRIGPGGEMARGGKKVPVWRQPWLFCYLHYNRNAFDENTYVLKPGARPKKVVWHQFRPAVARMYDSFNHVPQPSLRGSVKELQATAAECANIAPFRFIQGRLQAVIIPDISRLSFPIRDTDIAGEVRAAKEQARERELKAEVKEVARVELLQSMGYVARSPLVNQLQIRFGTGGSTAAVSGGSEDAERFDPDISGGAAGDRVGVGGDDGPRPSV